MTAAVDQVVERLGERVDRDVPLGPLSTYRVGGRAALLAEPASVEDLRLLAEALAGTELPVFVLGLGSNLLVADQGFSGLVVRLGEEFSAIEITDTRLRAGGAAGMPVVARRTAAAGLTGFEWAVGVPGSIGGGVRMNAGGHGSDIAATLRSIRVVDLAGGEDRQVPADALDLAYRHSNLTSTQVVVHADFNLERGDAAQAQAEIAEIVRWRRANQPGGQNAGSVFTNPPGDSAGRLIDAAGAKGLRIGTAAVSEKHANFIQVDRHGSAADVLAVMGRVRQMVYDHTGTVLEPETRIVGTSLPPLEVRP